jgi:hypothetical protein
MRENRLSKLALLNSHIIYLISHIPYLQISQFEIISSDFWVLPGLPAHRCQLPTVHWLVDDTGGLRTVVGLSCDGSPSPVKLSRYFRRC